MRLTDRGDSGEVANQRSATSPYSHCTEVNREAVGKVSKTQRKQLEEFVALALYRALGRRNPDSYVEEPERGFKTVIDGSFYFMSVVRSLLREMERAGFLDLAWVEKLDKSHLEQ